MVQLKKASIGAQFFWGFFVFSLAGLLVNFAASRGAFSKTDSYEEKRASGRVEKLKALRDEEAIKLSSYGWVDKAKGTVHIPIDRAIALSVVDLQQKPVAPSAVLAQSNVSNIVPPFLQVSSTAPAASAAPSSTGGVK